MDEQGAMPAVDVEVLDVGTEGLGDAQPVERQQTRQCMIASAAESAWTKNAPSSLRSSPRVEDS